MKTALGDEQKIADLLSKLRDPEKDPRLLYALLYMLRPELLAFIVGPITRLVKVAARTTKKTAVISKTGVRGAVLWQRTSVGRLTGRLNAGSFEIRVSERHQDLPENQLLKMFLRQLIELAEFLEPEVTSGASVKHIEIIRSKAKTLLQSDWLQDITTQVRVSSLLASRAKRSRDQSYGRILSYSQEYVSVFKAPRWIYVLNLIQSGWLQPVRDDDIFELYTLMKVIDVLSSDLDFSFPTRLGLISPRRKAVAHLERLGDSAEARIYFDQSPVSLFRVKSAYGTVLSNYEGFSIASRRPDMSIRFLLAGSSRTVLIECKDTADDGYTRDSVYKAFAYLSDFSELWATRTAQTPKVIVVFPDDVIRKRIEPADIVLVGADDVASLAEFIGAALTA